MKANIPFQCFDASALNRECAEHGGALVNLQYRDALAFLVIKLEYLSGYHHIGFYAGDPLFRAYTQTGYRSHFLMSSGQDSINDCVEWIRETLDEVMGEVSPQGALF